MTRRAPRRYSPRYGRRAGDEPTPTLSASSLDGGILTAVSILAGVGLVMVYSITAPLSDGAGLPAHFTRHAGALFAGAIALTVALRVPLALWRRVALPLWGVSVVLLVATAIAGVEVNGARRWLDMPGWRLQPAEIAKLATLLAVAAILAPEFRGRVRLKPIVVAFGLCVPPVSLLIAQPDFGSAAVIVATVGVVLFVGGVPMKQLLAPAIVAVVGAVAYVVARPYAHARWTGFLDPWATASREGFQLVQSFVAFGRGGAFGVGLGDGRQKLYYLPEAHTDFILSGIAEELGLVGVLIVLGAFAAFAAAGTRIASRCEEPFAALVAFAMTAFVAVPAATNAGVVMGLLPTTGFTLPLVSFGGNSLLVSAVAVGILLRIGACEAARPRARVSGASRLGIATR